MDKKKLSVYLLLLLVLLLLAAAVYMFFIDYRQLHHSGVLGYPKLQPRTSQGVYGAQPRHPLSLPEVDSIQSWMTFDYLNKAFNLPAEYLKDELGITSAAYPRVSVRKVAADQHIAVDAYLETLKETLRHYLTQHKPQ